MAISHPELVALHRNQFPNTCYGLGEWRRYSAGIWESVPELAVRLEIQRIAISAGAKVNNALVTSVLELLRAVCFVRDELFDADPSILTFNDCTLSLSTSQLREHRPADWVTTKLPFNYDASATSTAWEGFLQSTVPEYVDFLQEFAGYCLTPSTRYELALWLWGPPGGGKSTFIEGLRAMLGHRCCILGLSEVERSAFALSQLPGKTMAISTEQPTHGFVKSPHLLNAIISGEPVIVDRKFRDQITVVPRAKLVWGMNELPRIDSSGVGLFRRVVPIHFPAILPELRDPKVKEAIIEQGMAIANWALTGLARLTQREHFEIPEALALERETYRVQNDTPQLFLDECCERAEGCKVKSSALYNVYAGWAKRNGHGVQSSTALAAELRRIGLADHRYNDGKYWMDIQLREQEPFDVSKYDGLFVH